MEELARKFRAINPEYFDFLVKWQENVLYPAYGIMGLAILLYILYRIKYTSLKSMKEKFDHISQKEIKRLSLVHILIGASFFVAFNYAIVENVARAPMWFGIRFFIGVCIGVLYSYVALLILKYSWAARIHKKLRLLRYTPRTNPKTGNRMKLLSEEDEDAYLDEGMQAEENVFSVDYDVWIDERSGDTIIEKYAGHLTALECDRCGFQTLKLEKEEIVKEVTETEDGELLKEYKCSYCKRVKRNSVILSHKIRQDVSVGRLVDNPLDQDEHIVTVKLDLFSNNNDHFSYEFQNLKEAKKFLEEFDFEKIKDKVTQRQS
ncbi:MAG: hypothetical protein GY816_19455 [Cytophagales bacterium]|nr:hypothetical protein [Cytophagales bacterium]